MKEFSVSDARQDLPSLIELSGKEPVMISKHGTPQVVLISVEQYEVFVDALEELEDIAAAEAALREPGPSIPWEKVKKELGLA